jgi:capsular polysaccharide biosynthesis protein
MNIDDRLRAASKALKERSVAQVDAASRLRELVRRTGQPVAHGRTGVLVEEPQESPRSLAPSLPPSEKVSAAAAESSAAATPTSHWTDGETLSTFHSQSHSENAVGRLLGSFWRYKSLIAAAVLVGALLGYGWAARQPTLYEGVSSVLMTHRCPPNALCRPRRDQVQLMRSPAVLQRAVTLSGSRISAETLGQRLEIDEVQNTDLIRIRVVDSTATGAAQLADAVPTAYNRVVAQQSRQAVSQLRNTRSRLKARLAELDAELVGRPDNPVLRTKRAAVAAELSQVQRRLGAERTRALIVLARAAVPKRPISPSPGRTMVIGMLLGLLVAAVLVWWLTRRLGPTSSSSAPEQGPEMPPT